MSPPSLSRRAPSPEPDPEALPPTHLVPPPSDEAERRLHATLGTLGHSQFRPGQREIIASVVQGRDTVAIMPTGGGKSLCYQLPALMLPGVTVVVSPLIALMRDQVAALQQRGVSATFINSSLSQKDREERQHNLGRYRLVYVAPERFRSPRFCEALGRVPLQLLAIDEAHCISEWGHDFRPDYRRLREVVQQIQPPRLLALTATATPEVREDIVALLQLRDPQVFVHGFDRKNLLLSVDRCGGERDKLQRALRYLASTTSGVAIVYTATRKKAVSVAEGLRAAGLDARPYHAGLADEERRGTEEAFLSGRLPIIVATNAFGMGIDKRDVRLVLHHDLPRSPEAYYQEAGRAGRDGEPARCVLFFNPGDARVQEFLIEQSFPDGDTVRSVYNQVRDHGPISEDALRAGGRGVSGLAMEAALRALEEGGSVIDEGDGYQATGPLRYDARALAARQEREKQKLRRMVSYGYGSGCRMRFFLDYFGDHFRDGASRCGQCENCRRSETPLSDEEHLLVRKALSGVARMDGRYGKRRIAEVLQGHHTPEAERAGLTQLSTFGLIPQRSVPWLQDLLTALESAGLCATATGEYPVLQITPAGRAVMQDRARASVLLPSDPAPAAKTGKSRSKAKPKASARRADAPTPVAEPLPSKPLPPPPEDLPLTPAQEQRYERLRALRSDLAKELALPPFVVFHDRTLRAIARAFPADAEALAQVSGVGRAKLQRFGAKVLKVLRGEAS